MQNCFHSPAMDAHFCSRPLITMDCTCRSGPSTTQAESGEFRASNITVEYAKRRSRNSTPVDCGEKSPSMPGGAAFPTSSTNGKADQSRYTWPSHDLFAARVAIVTGGL